MTAKYNLHIAASIPPHIHPSQVIAALHDHNTALTLQALTVSHEKQPNTAPELLRDAYWYPTDINPVHTYSVTECVTVLPGFGQWGKKEITFPSCFQNIPTGIKTRADAPGVTVRADYRVIKGGADGEVEGEGQGIGDAAWVLVEDAEVSCSKWMMPFVKGKMEQAHRDICRKVIEKVEMQRRQDDLAKTVGRGKELSQGFAPEAIRPIEPGGRESYRVESPVPDSAKTFYG